MGSGLQMDKISLKRSMTLTFLITICLISIFSGIAIFLANNAQQEILKNRSLIIKNPSYQFDEYTNRYLIDIDKSEVEWQQLNIWQNFAYYGCYFIMIGFPILFIIIGIGSASAIYYRTKLRIPILQLQNGMRRIQENDLDFRIEYHNHDELGQLCHSMEKMRTELRHNNKVLWEMLEQRKLLNASVAHDLRTPITVLKGYLDYLQKNIPRQKLTKEMITNTLTSMQGAVLRLERYTECIQNLEKLENLEIHCEKQNTSLFLKEIQSNILQLNVQKKISFKSKVSSPCILIDKAVFFRVLENLLQNALRYAQKQLILNISQTDHWLKLSVTDDGQGFTEEELIHATTMFYGREKNMEHFGIGLGVCKLLCEKHGGFLEIKNNETGGACVTAILNIS